MTAINTE